MNQSGNRTTLYMTLLIQKANQIHTGKLITKLIAFLNGFGLLLESGESEGASFGNVPLEVFLCFF